MNSQSVYRAPLIALHHLDISFHFVIERRAQGSISAPTTAGPTGHRALLPRGHLLKITSGKSRELLQINERRVLAEFFT